MNYIIKKPLAWIFVFILFAPLSASANIIQTASLAPIKAATEKADKKTLVLFDVDDVIISQKPRTLKPAYRKSRLVDPGIVALINTIKAKQIKTAALTFARTGKTGKAQSFEDKRIHELASFGIDFSKSFPTVSHTQLGQPASHGAPLYKKGIIFTAHHNKGKILNAFLKHAKHKPTAIIFVDDQRSNLIAVANLCEKLQIPFTGFHYTAAKKLL